MTDSRLKPPKQLSPEIIALIDALARMRARMDYAEARAREEAQQEAS